MISPIIYFLQISVHFSSTAGVQICSTEINILAEIICYSSIVFSETIFHYDYFVSRLKPYKLVKQSTLYLTPT